MDKKLVIAIDFDGTCVTHSFPKIGKEIGAPPVLHKLVERGHKLILFTMRSNLVSSIGNSDKDIVPDKKGNFLNDAINWFNHHNIPLYGIQKNPGKERVLRRRYFRLREAASLIKLRATTSRWIWLVPS